MTNPTNELLQGYYQAKYPDQPALRVSDLTNITTGWECEVYSFHLAWDRADEDLILRLYAGDGRDEKCEKEFFIISQLGQVNYPVPRVYLIEKDHSLFERPFIIMEKINGREMWAALKDAALAWQAAHSEQPSAALNSLVDQFCDLSVRLHALDWRAFAPIAPGDPGASPYYSIDRALDYARWVAEQFPSAGFQALNDWLAGRRGELACERPALIHFDYHPGNLLIREDGSAVVIDWTASSVLDPRMDLGWTLLLTSIYSGQEFRDAFLAGYERLSGSRVEHIEVFEVIACLRRLTDILVSTRMGAEKFGMRPETEAIMKQQAGPLQKVYDLMQRHTGIRIMEIEDMIQSFMLK